MKYTLKILLIILLITLSCSQKSMHKNTITVSIVPQKYFVKQIVKDKFSVNVMIPNGASPATYEPTPRQMKKLSQSIIYFRIGYIPFEMVWLQKIRESNKEIIIADSFSDINFIKMGNHNHDKKTLSPHKKLNGKGYDPHIWLSPKQVKIQAKNIFNTVCNIDPLNKNFYQTNYDAFVNELDKLDNYIINKLKSIRNRNLMVFHPSLGYYTRDYNLHQFVIEKEGKTPGPKHIKEMINIAREKDIRIIFVQVEFDSTSAKAIADEINGEVIIFNPLDENWKDNMIKITDIFYKVLNK